MAARLPKPGGDDGNWGTILNDFLEVSLNSDGSLANNTVGTNQIQNNAVTNAQLASAVQAQLSNINGAYIKPNDGIPSSDLSNDVQTELTAASSALQTTGGTMTGPIAGFQDKGSQVVNVKAWGATGNGTTDDTPFIQAAIDYVRSTSLPGPALFFPPGIYLVTKSLDFTNIQSEGEDLSIAVAGSGIGATRIMANLTEPYPVFDFTGSAWVHFHDFFLTGANTGLQTAAIMFARGGSGDYGDNPTVERFHVDGSFSVAEFVCISADQGHVVDCSFNGGLEASAVLSTDNPLNLTSKYQPFSDVLSLALFQFTNTNFIPAGNVAISVGHTSSLTLDNCYCNLATTSGSGYAIEINAPIGYNSIFARNLRVESNGATSDTHLLHIPAGCAVGQGEITGIWSLYGAASVVQFDDNTGSLSNVRFSGDAEQQAGTGTCYFFTGANNFYNCDIVIQGTSGWGYNTSLTGSPYGNIIRQGNNTPWSIDHAGDTGANIQLSGVGFPVGAIQPPSLSFKYRTAFGARLSSGVGVPYEPANQVPVAGDIYFRTDTPNTPNQNIYICTVGGSSPTWVGIL